MSRNIATNRIAVRNQPYSLSFDGVDDEVNLGTFDPSVGDITITMWLLPLVMDAGNTRQFIAKRDNWGSVNDNRWIFVRSGGSNTIHFERWGAGVDFGVDVKVGKWQHLAMTHKYGVESKLYIDGALVSTQGTFTYGTKTDAKISIGSNASAGEIFKGKILDTRIYNTALTSQQVHDLYYNNIVPRDNLVAEYFNSDEDGSGSVLKDTSGNGNDGTIVGAEWTEDTAFKPRIAVRNQPYALSFDKSAYEYVSLADSYDCTQPHTIEADLFIIKDSNFPSTDNNKIFTTNRTFFSLRGKNIRFGVEHTKLISTPFEHRKWIKLVGVMVDNNETIKFYKDAIYIGELDISGAGAGLVGAPWRLGASVSSYYDFGGIISLARIYNTALTSQQVHDLYYNNIVPRDNLVAEYFNSDEDGSGSVLKDTSGNGNDGTIVGAEWTEDTAFKKRVIATGRNNI